MADDDRDLAAEVTDAAMAPTGLQETRRQKEIEALEAIRKADKSWGVNAFFNDLAVGLGIKRGPASQRRVVARRVIDAETAQQATLDLIVRTATDAAALAPEQNIDTSSVEETVARIKMRIFNERPAPLFTKKLRGETNELS